LSLANARRKANVLAKPKALCFLSALAADPHAFDRLMARKPWQNKSMPPHPPSPVPDFLYGTAWKENRTPALTEQAIRMGFRAIDTANQRRHYFEEGVGQALAAVYRTGLVRREDLFLQTKFTYQPGQDHRLPYDPAASLSTQVAQSMTSSLDHLGTDYVDSYVLHGPSSNYGWGEADAEVWDAMRKERDAGRTRLLGVSNVSLDNLQQMLGSRAEVPGFVQNRCYARFGWDRAVRQFCQEHKIIYQGFSLLTANQEVLNHPRITASSASATPAQVIFSFARSIAILPLTGTSNSDHMKQDLESREVKLAPDTIKAIESLAG
jgi:diketogulonate reductase-like aldo/keto reductase